MDKSEYSQIAQAFSELFSYNLNRFFSNSPFINFNAASKSSSKKFDTSPYGTTNTTDFQWYFVYDFLYTLI